MNNVIYNSYICYISLGYSYTSQNILYLKITYNNVKHLEKKYKLYMKNIFFIVWHGVEPSVRSVGSTDPLDPTEFLLLLLIVASVIRSKSMAMRTLRHI